MKDKDQKYNELIGRIRSERPTPDNPQELTSEILSSIERLSCDEKISSGRSMMEMPLKIIFRVSSVAAVLLISLFILERSAPVVSPVQSVSVSGYSSYSSMDIENIEKDEVRDVVSVVVRERQNQRRERRSFYEGIVNKHQ